MEEAVQFTCLEKRLYGILHLPDAVSPPASVVLVLTGGPQVRIGAHRLYVGLSRYLADHGVPTLRFDYEGLGDSDGKFVGYQHAGGSITSAISFLRQRFGQELKVFIWSLCDGSTAAMLYAAQEQDVVQGLVLCNPYLMSEDELARATVKYYYYKRIFNRLFWKKLFSFKVNLIYSFKSLSTSLCTARIFCRNKETDDVSPSISRIFCRALAEYPHPVRIILSSDDIVASAFIDLVGKYYVAADESDAELKVVPQIIKGANHTFTEPESKRELFKISLNSVLELEAIAVGGTGENHAAHD